MESENIKGDIQDQESQKASLNRAAHQKLDELIAIISRQDLDNETLESLQKKISTAIGLAMKSKPSQELGPPQIRNMDNDLDQLLFINKLDKTAQKKYSIYRALDMGIRVFIGLLLILLGFGMIIMPAPPYFEMFTLFYINPNDGVTVMDVISLIVAFIGVYILVRTLIKRK